MSTKKLPSFLFELFKSRMEFMSFCAFIGKFWSEVELFEYVEGLFFGCYCFEYASEPLLTKLVLWVLVLSGLELFVVF